MPETPTRNFEIICKGCGRSLETVDRIREPQIDRLVTHLRACAASERLADAPMLGDLMARIRVVVVEQA